MTAQASGNPAREDRPIGVVVIDDHPVFRMGMTALLNSLPGIAVIGQASSADHARQLFGLPGAGEADRRIERIGAAEVDVVLMDLDLGDGSGADLTRELLHTHPGLRVLVVTMHEDDDAVVASVRAGARGFLVKSAPPDSVERAVRAVAAGELILSPSVAAHALDYVVGGQRATRLPFPQLTPREREVLDLVAAGLDNTAIAARLSLSPKTVRNTIATVLAKLSLRDRSAAIVRARAEGLGGGADQVALRGSSGPAD
ncbi:LuxR family two component transcriptional regulator [Brevibacterium sanguinis]|uniref:LuxR family two component transcriptional regulator n=2 Tax=Brevibacterium TaxID=1696 RepID=A0A366IM04_9MICO|nr:MULTISPECIES: response regulator transcription factor [Brevibacterium]RBP65668.1 LuxR family two component transcriptional regulator [Brevibacterium sanguinis]RBP72302.1 LuxR family two component transcriptional regulator [Brevibacterium celere]